MSMYIEEFIKILDRKDVPERFNLVFLGSFIYKRVKDKLLEELKDRVVYEIPPHQKVLTDYFKYDGILVIESELFHREAAMFTLTDSATLESLESSLHGDIQNGGN